MSTVSPVLLNLFILPRFISTRLRLDLPSISAHLRHTRAELALAAFLSVASRSLMSSRSEPRLTIFFPKPFLKLFAFLARLCGGWDLNPGIPKEQAPQACAFGQTRAFPRASCSSVRKGAFEGSKSLKCARFLTRLCHPRNLFFGASLTALGSSKSLTKSFASTPSARRAFVSCSGS